jgi:small subunit ribosomal protein S8
MVTDPIANFIVQIKNASTRGHARVLVQHSKLSEKIAELLEKEGLVKTHTKKGKKVRKNLEIELIKGRIIKEAKRISKPSKRVYRNAKDLRRFARVRGLTVVSTPKGLMSSQKAVKENVGGEVMFTIK